MPRLLPRLLTSYAALPGCCLIASLMIFAGCNAAGNLQAQAQIDEIEPGSDLSDLDSSGGSEDLIEPVDSDGFELPDEDSNGEVIDEPAAKTPFLYVAYQKGSGVAGFADPAFANGNVAPEVNLAGSQTGLLSPVDLAVRTNGFLTVLNYGLLNGAITSHSDSETLNGNYAPDTNLTGPATALGSVACMAFNNDESLLFVTGVSFPGRIRVFASESASDLSGNISPMRQIEIPHAIKPSGMTFGANDTLYIVNYDGTIYVLENASTLNGSTSVSRTIECDALTAAGGLFIDEFDTLYVVDNTAALSPAVLMFHGASSLNGVVEADMALEVPTAVLLTDVVVDSAGTGYLADYGGDAILVFDDIVEQNGSLAPDRKVAGSNTRFDAPVRLFIDE